MKSIFITSHAREVIRNHAKHGLRETGRRLAEDIWEIPVSDDVFAMLQVKTLIGETPSETESYDDPVERKPRVGLRVDNAKRPGTRA